MERLTPQTKEELDATVARAAEVLNGGGLIIYPTDTVYGIGVDATDIKAIDKVYTLKGRDTGQPLSVVVSDITMAEEYAEVGKQAKDIMGRVLPGPVTIILKKKETVPDELVAGGDTIGIRIPDSYFCSALAKRLGKPYTTTSANRSGRSARSLDEVLGQFQRYEDLIDLVIDTGSEGLAPPSTILDASGEGVTILREGAVNRDIISSVTARID